MKKIIISLLCVTIVIGATAFGCSKCEHEYGEGKTTRPATCTMTGEIQYTCSKCGEIKTQEVPKTTHNVDDYYTIEEDVHYKKCADCDYKQNESAHEYSSEYYYDDENHWKECLACGKTMGEEEHSSANCVCGYESATQGLEFTIMIGAESYAVTGIGSASGRIVIPYSYKGLPVAKIDDYAFINSANVTSVRIPRSVTTIGERVFENCENLQSVSFDKGSNLTSIGSGAFAGCQSLISITIPKKVQVVGFSVFYGCANLEQVTFEEGSALTVISHEMFGECDSLVSITIPNYVSAIKESAFMNCDKLENVNFASKENLNVLESTAFYGCESLTSFEIVESVAQIGAKVFSGCYNLKTINFNAVECSDMLYDAGAFDGVGYSVLEQTKVVIGEKVTKIPAYLFYTVQGIRSANVNVLDFTNNSACVKIGEYSFAGLSSLTEIRFANDSAILEISNYAFSQTGVTSVSLPEKLTTIGAGVFEDCVELVDVTISDSLLSIGMYAFVACENLESVTISDDALLQTIGAYAFFECLELVEFKITKNVESIGANAFANCNKLVSVDFKVKDGWTAGEDKISAQELNSKETSAQYLTEDYYHVQWSR